MAEIKNVFFDLDGTLLWMDQEQFVEVYCRALGEELAPYGYPPEQMTAALWAGVKAMVLSDGSALNEEVFWKCFEKQTKRDSAEAKEVCSAFYTGNFNRAKVACRKMQGTREMLQTLRAKGIKTIVATNPVFPLCAVHTRLAWAGLSPDDFDYVTSYSTERACKPSPKFYTDLLEKLQLKAEETLMVGNDEREDMYAGKLAGLDTFLVTDCLIPDEKHPYEGKRGDFSCLIEYLKTL